jgi:hypothetical protein
MIYSIISVDKKNMVEIVEIEDEAIGNFFKENRKVFSGKASELLRNVVDKIEAIAGEANRLWLAHILQIIDLAGTKKRQDVFNYLKSLQKQHSCQYIIGR